jgi:hypothetical protein
MLDRNPFGPSRRFQIELGVQANQGRRQIRSGERRGAEVSSDRGDLTDSRIRGVAGGLREHLELGQRGKSDRQFGVRHTRSNAYFVIENIHAPQFPDSRNRDIRQILPFLSDRGSHNPRRSGDRRSRTPTIGKRGDRVGQRPRDVEPFFTPYRHERNPSFCAYLRVAGRQRTLSSRSCK